MVLAAIPMAFLVPWAKKMVYNAGFFNQRWIKLADSAEKGLTTCIGNFIVFLG